MSEILIIGGGAAGMMAACTVAQRGKRVRLLEKNPFPGKKLRITGKGRCNLTNAAPPDILIEGMPGNPFFMYSAFYGFGSAETIDFFNNIGLPTKVERGNRVFPASDKAADVVRCLEGYMKKNGVGLCCNTEVSELRVRNGRVTGAVTADGHCLQCSSLLIATGGLSYPATGSTGDGYKLARATGHRVTGLYPSLTSLKASDEWIGSLEGLSLKNIAINVRLGGKPVYRDFGELMFTGDGVSGPVILSASRSLLGAYNRNPELLIDLKPALDDAALDKRILRDFSKYENRDLRNALDELLPKRLIPVIIAVSGIPCSTKVRDVTREQRKALLNALKRLTLHVTGSGGFDEAVVTAGGVATEDIDPSTMRSRIIENLYFAGEVIDIDGYTGGFNLQAAFSTGRLAGMNL